jgi:hypothetical protein
VTVIRRFSRAEPAIRQSRYWLMTGSGTNATREHVRFSAAIGGISGLVSDIAKPTLLALFRHRPIDFAVMHKAVSLPRCGKVGVFV